MEQSKNKELHLFFHNQQVFIRKTEEFVRSKLEREASGHNWWHVHRVRNMALTLACEEKVSVFVVDISSLLHDIADLKFQDGCNDEIGQRIAKEWLGSYWREYRNKYSCCRNY